MIKKPWYTVYTKGSKKGSRDNPRAFAPFFCYLTLGGENVKKLGEKKRFNLYLTPTDRARLDALTAARREPAAVVIRRLICEAATGQREPQHNTTQGGEPCSE